jgi:AcrR family transcriptional regulator
LWDDHKARTRWSLYTAALKLFAAQGFENTTVDQIAAKARVSRRTFFRYFPSKEAALFGVHREWVQLLAETYAAQPASFGEMEALAATFVNLAKHLPKDRLLLYTRAVSSSPVLRRQSPEYIHEELGRLADAIAARRSLSSADEDCVLLAFVGWVTHKRAHDRWAELGPDIELSDVVADEFRRLVRLFAS